jgi:DNA repair protein RadC
MNRQLTFVFDDTLPEALHSLGRIARTTRDAHLNTLYVRESSAYFALTDAQVMDYARKLVGRGLRPGAKVLDQPTVVRDFLRLQLSRLDYEVFGCLYLDRRNRLVEMEEIFRGTIDQAAVYPREILKAALRHAACAVLAYHNHPSGVSEPSPADETITRRLREALSLIDVTLLDHLIVGESVFSFSEHGLL